MNAKAKPNLRLVTIGVSHYCEKARWALSRAGLPYEELRHIQLFHYGATLWHARSLFAPVLLAGDEKITDSTDILRYVDAQVAPEQRLFPEAEPAASLVREWEELFDVTVGVESRRWLYHVSFELLEFHQVRDLIAQGAPGWQRAVLRPLLPFAELYLRWRLSITPEAVATGLASIRAVFERVSKVLADGRPYLAGDRFTAADLSFAALSALVVMPPEYGVQLPDPAELPASVARTVESFRNTPAGRHALTMFARERGGCRREPRSAHPLTGC